jgi:hypothetical protein
MATSTIGSVNYFLRTLVYGAVVGLLAWGGWHVRELTQKHERELAERDQRIEELQARVRELELALKLLKVDHRLALLTVKDQRLAPALKGGIETDVAFQELDAQGEALGPEQLFTVVGKVAYIDALVIKFDDNYVEQGDALRGSSICFFRRLFGEYQQPNEGFPLDSAGTRPRSYGAGDDAPEPMESELWRHFWDYANDPAKAAGAGVRALHGEAPYIELRPGGSYRVELRASGGLTVRPE